MKKILFLACCLTGLIGSSQNGTVRVEGIGNEGSGDMSAQMLSKFRAIGQNRNASLDNITGSAYLSDVFLPTKLYYGDEFINNAFYRYNAYNKEIEVKNSLKSNDDNINALNKDKKIGILVGNKMMSFKTFVTSKDRTLNGYLISLLNGKDYDLYKREHVVFSPGRISANSFVKAVPNRFVNFTEYYFQKEGVKRIDEIVPSNNKFLKLLDGETRTKMKSFLKESDLNVNDEADLIKIFQELNKK